MDYLKNYITFTLLFITKINVELVVNKTINRKTYTKAATNV